MSKFKKSSLCWDCANALCGCDWSRDFKPVEGWEAKFSPATKNKVESYHVISCPQFEKDKERK